MEKIMTAFNTLWENYPRHQEITALRANCYNKQENSSSPFKNYCSIMMSECLIKSGVNISGYNVDKCWSHTGSKHILRAEDFANSLKLSPPSPFGRMEKIDPATFQKKLKDKTGIIFFKDYWQREVRNGEETFENRSGDHIDLWNKTKITGESMFTRSIYEFFGATSDLNKCKEIWFWQVK